MRLFCEPFNIRALTTAAESPWSNDVCERMNAVISDMVRKILEESSCDLEMALASTVSARNALSNN